MPGNAIGPRFALMAEVDMTAWAGVAVFRRGASGSVTLPADAGVYEDPVAFLNGYGSQAGRDINAIIAPKWAATVGVGTLTVDLSPTDGFRITSTDKDFGIAAGAGNATWGLSTAGHGKVGGSAPYVRVAPGQWVRGVVQDGGFIITTTSGAVGIGLDGWAQSVPALLRTSAEGDADDGVADSFTTLDNDAYDATTRSIMWGIDDDGHVFCAYPSTESAIVWLDTSFRDRLGFSGNESVTSSGNLRILRADDPMPGVIVPARPMRRGPLPTFVQFGEGVVTRGGDVHGVTVGHAKLWDFEFWLGDLVSQVDEHRHFIDHLLEYVTPGSRVTLFQQWGDPRRAIEDRAGAVYSTLETPERNGYRGRLRCKAPPDPLEISYEHERELRVRGLVQMRLYRAVD